MAANTATQVLMQGGAKTGITALAGGATPTLAAHTLEAVNFISTCATNGDSVILPAGMPLGTVIYVQNNGAARADVFPPTGGTINAGTVTTGDYGIATLKGGVFIQYGSDGLSWIGMTSA